MTKPSNRLSFPFWGISAILTAVAVVLAGVGMALTEWTGGSAANRQAVAWAAATAWASMLVGLVPLRALLPGGPIAAMWGYFSGAAGRVLLALTALMLGATWGHLPPPALVLAFMGVYLPLLFLEAGLVGRYLWAKDMLVPPVACTRLDKEPSA